MANNEDFLNYEDEDNTEQVAAEPAEQPGKLGDSAGVQKAHRNRNPPLHRPGGAPFAIPAVKVFQKRILVATKLQDTYLHRLVRAGRFGSKGLAVTLVSDEEDAKILNELQNRFDVNITEFPDEINLSSYIEWR